ncbi:MAG: arginine/lysine/ornithine decarboxylase [Conexibacter sp.]|nr:arginine/lysine/ornithine decarboxylase [Conexibacter sp.]
MEPITPSPIVRALNEDVRRYHRWSTPSILPGQERVEDFYASDVSISAGFFGTLVDHTGVFGEAERFAAAAQGADRTMFSVHGSSGSNWVVLRMLAMERQDGLVLVARNIHHSIMNAIKAFDLDFRFLPAPYDARFEALMPPSVDDVVSALDRYPEALAVIYTSPTYEGLAGNTEDIAAAVHARSEECLVFVDEAWGGHLHFHGDLPCSAMAGGADICVQSTHKLAGGLQQTGLIHWREERVDSELLEEAYREYVTTSPSYGLLASADAAVRALAARGTELLGESIARTERFKGALRRALSDLDLLDDPRWLDAVRRNVSGADLVKTTLGLSRFACTGYEVAEALVQRGIVIEKAGVSTITLITTFQLADEAVDATVAALSEILDGKQLPGNARRPAPGNPFAGIDDRPVIRPHDAKRLAKSVGHEVPLRDAIGKVAAEEVEVYPPGIPLILEGFRVGADAVRYLEQARESGGSIVARDTSLATLRVL